MSTSNIDEGKLNAFIGQMLSDLGGASSIAVVRLGDTLGLYLREWLSHQAASNYRQRRRQRPGLQASLLEKTREKWL